MNLATRHEYVMVYIGTEIDLAGIEGPPGAARTIAVFTHRDHAGYLVKR
jgi:hypothetical protein